MATTKDSKAGLTRRGFVAACGVGAAATFIPGSAVAARGTGPAAHIPGLRAWYTGTLEQFAEELKPQFLAGKVGDIPTWPPSEDDFSPLHQLGDAICERFGLRVTEQPDEVDGGMWLDGDDATSHLILAVSPSAAGMDDGGWHHVAYWAQAAVEEDLLKIAESRGWIVRPK